MCDIAKTKEESQQYKKEWREKNRDRLMVESKRYYHENKEKSQNKHKKRYEDPEYRKIKNEQVKAYTLKNIERVKEARRLYTLKNKENRKTYLKENKEMLRVAKREYDKNLKVNSWAKMLFRRSKARSNQCKFENNLSVEFIEDLFSKQNGKCYWLGVDMKITLESKHPLQISMDRLDNSKGYTTDNVVLCTFFANMGRNSATVDVLLECIERIKKSLLS